MTPNGISRCSAVGYHFSLTNGDATYDTSTGALYLTSLYPFQYIVNWSGPSDVTPCCQQVGVESICPKKATTLPVRAQARMDIDGDFSKLYTGTAKLRAGRRVLGRCGLRGWSQSLEPVPATNDCQHRCDAGSRAPVDFDATDFVTHPGGTLRWFNGNQILFLGAAPSNKYGGDIQTLCNAAQASGALNPGGVRNSRNLWFRYYAVGN